MEFSIKNHYFNLTRTQQVLFKKKVIENLGINYGNFYSWITRDSIPNKFKEQFAAEVLEQPIEKIFPEYQAA